MRERERFVVGGLTALMVLLWLGFLVHRSPRFPGSAPGSALGISGALLMLVPLAYLIVKRVPALRTRATRRTSLRTLLAWHIYAGIVGPILALLHTGHRFVSPLGIALTTSVLVVALSGFVGRYLLRLVGEEERERRADAGALRAEYERIAHSFRNANPGVLAPLNRPLRRLAESVLFTRAAVPSPNPALRALQISEALANVEYAVKTQELFKRWFARWLRVHIALAVALYLLLAAHIAAELSLGLRWL